MSPFLASLTLWQRIDLLDKWLFIQLNSRLTNPLFDAVMPLVRDKLFWAPLYLFLLVFVTLNFGKKGWLWCIAFLCTVALTDLVGTRVFKEGVERLRPCQDPGFSMYVRLLLKQCAGGYSFISNHAANHFGIATFFSLTFYPLFKRWVYIAYIWAALIAYAQVYVGVHYPLDVVAGAGLGVLAGLLTASIMNSKIGSFTLETT